MLEAPEFFVGRSLGRRQVPDLLKAAGLRLNTLADVHGIPRDESVEDVEWLELAGRRGWPVLMKDDRIRYRPAEREALPRHEVRAFCLTSGNLRAGQMAGQIIAVVANITAACEQPGPFLFAISRAGLRRVEL